MVTTAFVWIDGHLVCQDGKAYTVAVGNYDNPLPIQPAKILPFRAHVMYNGCTTESCRNRCDPSTVEAVSVGCFNDSGHQCGYTALGSNAQNSWQGAGRHAPARMAARHGRHGIGGVLLCVSDDLVASWPRGVTFVLCRSDAVSGSGCYGPLCWACAVVFRGA